MGQGMLRIASEDVGFPDLIERLAQTLDGIATVYTPHPVIKPHERRAIQPRELLVRLDEASSFEIVHRAVRTYLEGDPDREVTVEHGDRSVHSRLADLPDAEAMARDLFETEMQAPDKEGDQP